MLVLNMVKVVGLVFNRLLVGEMVRILLCMVFRIVLIWVLLVLVCWIVVFRVVFLLCLVFVRDLMCWMVCWCCCDRMKVSVVVDVKVSVSNVIRLLRDVRLLLLSVFVGIVIFWML